MDAMKLKQIPPGPLPSEWNDPDCLIKAEKRMSSDAFGDNDDDQYVDTESDYIEGAGRCPDCREQVPIGGWPFCASAANPDGHANGVYAWKSGFGMRMQGWTRRER